MKPKIDTHSIKFKTWLYFVVFAAALMIALWITQVFLLNTFYSTMKATQTEDVAASIENSYQTNDSDVFLQDVRSFSNSYDMYIFVVSFDGKTTYFSPGTDEYVTSYDFSYSAGSSSEAAEEQKDHFAAQIRLLNEQMVKKNGTAQIKFKNKGDSQEMMACGKVLRSKDKDAMIVYIFSPLWPVSSTIKILKDQLFIVTIISLILACVISFYLSTRITRPIRRIEGSAKRLAAGEYGIVFGGGHYTELINLADTLTGASIALEKSDMMQKDLVANVSHDLRTPLTMIKSYAEMIRDISGEDPKKRDAHLQVIIDETERLNNLVDDLLTVSRLQSSKLVLEKTYFNLKDTLLQTVNTYRVMELESDYNFTLDCPSDCMVYADEEKIKQVISNLLSNAIKFCGETGQIDIALKKRGRTVTCSIRDYGVGIAPEDLDHIWDRYYRSSNNTARDASGSGLGLAICKEILTLHKSRFGVDSTLGKGTRFWFELDLKKQEQSHNDKK